MSSARNSISTIEDFIQTVGAIKSASDGGTPLSEPGSIGGETTHPVKKVDDRLETPKEGERSSENSKDVKKAVGTPSVENAAEASTKNAASIFGTAGRFAKKADGAVSTPGSAEADHQAVTTKVAPTGEDPASETNSAKAGKEDKKQGGLGGTTHPASTENDSLDGHKYAADTPLEKLAGAMQAQGDSLLAAIHGIYNRGDAQPQGRTKAAQSAPQGNDDRSLAYFAGHELAGLVNGTMDKRAADKLVEDTLVGVMKQASDDADAYIQYANHFFRKLAEGEMPPEEGGGEAGGDPMAEMGGEAGGGGDEAMMAALGGDGGEDPMAAMAGGAGGPPPGGGGGAEGGGEIEILLKAMEGLGITPEQLEQAIQSQMGGGAGGPPPGAGGPPPGAGGPPPGAGGPPPGAGGPPPMGGMETQAGVGGGKQNVKVAQMMATVQEIIARSRR